MKGEPELTVPRESVPPAATAPLGPGTEIAGAGTAVPLPVTSKTYGVLAVSLLVTERRHVNGATAIGVTVTASVDVAPAAIDDAGCVVTAPVQLLWLVNVALPMVSGIVLRL